MRYTHIDDTRAGSTSAVRGGEGDAVHTSVPIAAPLAPNLHAPVDDHRVRTGIAVAVVVESLILGDSRDRNGASLADSGERHGHELMVGWPQFVGFDCNPRAAAPRLDLDLE